MMMMTTCTIHDNETTPRRFIPSMPCYITVFLVVLSLIASRASAFSYPTCAPKPSCRRRQCAFPLFSSLRPDDGTFDSMAVSSFQDFLEKSNNNDFIKAAAESTLQSCPLLGTRSIGVDYGLVRTGIASTIGYNPQPLTITSNLNTTQLCHTIIDYCISERAQQVICGLPLHKNGTEAVQSQLTREFCTELACWILVRLGPRVPLYLWDERFTSKEAAARLVTKHGNQRQHTRHWMPMRHASFWKRTMQNMEKEPNEYMYQTI